MWSAEHFAQTRDKSANSPSFRCYLVVSTSYFMKLHTHLSILKLPWSCHDLINIACLVIVISGSLEILETVSCGQFYDGFRAHILEKVHPKALECSRLMPNVLRCTLLPCCDCWAEIFQNYSPTVNDMALFFSPGDFERSVHEPNL